jgi:hypothetical protein
MVFLIGCQRIDKEEVPIEVPIEKQTISLVTSDIKEIRIIKPDLANLSNQDVLITLNDQKTFDNLKQILNNAVHKDGAFEDILHDYEIIILKRDGSLFTIRYWVKFKRFEDDFSKNYIMDSKTANKMNSFFKTLGLQ